VSRNKIALVSTYFHHSRDSIQQMLAAAFPEYQIDNIFADEVITKFKNWIPPNLLYVGREFGMDILLRRTTIRRSYRQTTYVFRRLREAMAQIISPERYACSFQTQSICDASVPGIPHFIYTDHTHLSNLHYSYFNKRNLRSSKWIDLERSMYHNAARVFTRSKNIADDLARFYGVPEEKVICVFAGANAPATARDSGTGDRYSRANVLFVGNDWERKGGRILLEAFRQVRRAIPHAHLTIVGPAIRTDMSCCTCLGQLALAELTEQFQKASVFCLPTQLEPFGIALVEAMLHKLPVVATRVGAIPEIVQDGSTGDLVPPGDAGALAETLIRLLKDPERCRNYGEAGYQRATAVYSWQRVGERIRQAVMPLIARSSNATSARAAQPTSNPFAHAPSV
jgi:glycosyltransferase involved in cell wall biosynthesis